MHAANPDDLTAYTGTSLCMRRYWDYGRCYVSMKVSFCLVNKSYHWRLKLFNSVSSKFTIVFLVLNSMKDLNVLKIMKFIFSKQFLIDQNQQACKTY